MTLTLKTLGEELDKLKPGEVRKFLYPQEVGAIFGDPKLGKNAVKAAEKFARKHNCLFSSPPNREPTTFEKLKHDGRTFDG